MLDFGIVDAHLHIWDVDRFLYPWLDDIPLLNRSYTLNEYNEATRNVRVDKMVFVQCECEPSQHLMELEWVAGVARREQRIRGIVPWAPLEKGRAVEEELCKMKQNPLVKGIRRIIQFEPDMRFCLKPGFIAGVKLLAEYGLTFDVCIDYRHSKAALCLLEQCPEVKCILDHIGKPDIKGGGLDPWRDEIRALAGLPNLWCKVSSLATEADHESWTVDGLRPYVDCIFESFGFERTVFAGDWPVSSIAADYDTCVQTVLKLTDGATRRELRKLFRENAENFYGV